MKSMASTSVGFTEIIPTDQEDVSKISDGVERKPSVCFYPKTLNKKGKNYTKSRQCIKGKKLTVAHYSCCNKPMYYAIGGRKHDRTCLVDHLKTMSNNNSRKRRRF